MILSWFTSVHTDDDSQIKLKRRKKKDENHNLGMSLHKHTEAIYEKVEIEFNEEMKTAVIVWLYKSTRRKQENMAQMSDEIISAELTKRLCSK